MKRLIAMALALMLCGCALAEGNWYVNEGLALVQRMQTLAADDAYFHLYATGNEDMNALREAFVETDLSRPAGARFMALPEDSELRSALERMALLGGAEGDLSEINQLSDVGMEELVKRLPAVASNVLTAESGVEWVALSGVLTVSASLEAPEDFVPGYLLMEYPGDFAVLIGFSRPLGGYLGATARPVPANCLEAVEPMLTYVKAVGLDLELEEIELN